MQLYEQWNIHDIRTNPSSIFIFECLWKVIVVQCDMWLDSCLRDILVEETITELISNSDIFYFANQRKSYLTIANEFIDEIVVILQSLGVDGSSTIYKRKNSFRKGSPEKEKY